MKRDEDYFFEYDESGSDKFLSIEEELAAEFFSEQEGIYETAAESPDNIENVEYGSVKFYDLPAEEGAGANAVKVFDECKIFSAEAEEKSLPDFKQNSKRENFAGEMFGNQDKGEAIEDNKVRAVNSVVDLPKCISGNETVEFDRQTDQIDYHRIAEDVYRLLVKRMRAELNGSGTVTD
jgi:hypothetical protein